MKYCVRSTGLESEAVTAALSSDEKGCALKYVVRLEHAIAQITGENCTAFCSPFCALKAALACFVRKGDRVIVPDCELPFAAEAVLSLGAQPIFVDCNDTDTLAAKPCEAAMQCGRIAAAIFDDAYGTACDYDTLLPLFKSANVATVSIISDNLFADTGADIKIAAFGFDKLIYAQNSAVTITADKELQIALKNRARAKTDELAFVTASTCNNVAAAIGLCQLSRLDNNRRRRARVCSWYELLEPHIAHPNSTNVVARVKDPDFLINSLCRNGYYAKRTAKPLHTVFAAAPFFPLEKNYAAALSFYNRNVLLPTLSPSRRDVEKICSIVKKFV